MVPASHRPTTLGPIQEIYPPEHERFAEDIVRCGALISEVSPIEKMAKPSFIRRNRITSGLSQAILLCESDGAGGTLQQFQVAKKQGRPIFVLRPTDRTSVAWKGFERFTREPKFDS
jgi:DNA processing protein